MFYDSASNRRLIEVRSATATTSVMSVSEFLDFLDDFTKDSSPDNEIVIEGQDGIGVREVRLENEQEYDARIQAAKDHAFKVQQEADRSWKRQQARFARSRKK
jgi:hypothetical protein